MKEQKWIIAVVVGVMAMAGIFFSLSLGKKPVQVATEAPLTPFGQYMKDNGVKFYGSKYCSHCENMKNELGEATWGPVYVECIEGTKTLAKACIDANIEAFPTWELKNGERHVGEMPIDTLKEFVGYKDEVATTTPVDVK